MPNRTSPYPSYNFLVTLTSGHGLVSTLGGFSEAVGLRGESATVTLKRGLVNSTVLRQWIIQSRTAQANAAQSAVVTLRGESGQAMMSWQLANVTPSSYNGPTLQGKGSGDVALEELVLTVGSIQIIAPLTIVYGAQWGRMVKR